jgi:hypothetical protein
MMCFMSPGSLFPVFVYAFSICRLLPWIAAGCSWVLLLCFLASVLLWLWKPVPLAFWEPVPLLFLFFLL